MLSKMENLIQELEKFNDDMMETNELTDGKEKTITSTDLQTSNTENNDEIIADDINEKYIHLYRISLAVVEKNKELNSLVSKYEEDKQHVEEYKRNLLLKYKKVYEELVDTSQKLENSVLNANEVEKELTIKTTELKIANEKNEEHEEKIKYFEQKLVGKYKEYEERIKYLKQKLVDKNKELDISILKNKEYEERVKYLVDTIISKSKEETAENFTIKTALIENNRALLRYNNELLDTKSQLESFISKNKSESEERWTENNRVLLETNMVLQNVNKILREDKVDVLQRTYPINIDFDDASKEWNNDITNRKTKVEIEKEELESQVTDGEDESKEPNESDKNREHGEGDKHQKNEFQIDSPPIKSCKKLSDIKVLARRGGQPRKQNHYPKRKRTLPLRFIDQREERQWGKDTIKRVKVSDRITHELITI